MSPSCLLLWDCDQIRHLQTFSLSSHSNLSRQMCGVIWFLKFYQVKVSVYLQLTRLENEIWHRGGLRMWFLGSRPSRCFLLKVFYLLQEKPDHQETVRKQKNTFYLTEYSNMICPVESRFDSEDTFLQQVPEWRHGEVNSRQTFIWITFHTLINISPLNVSEYFHQDSEQWRSHATQTMWTWAAYRILHLSRIISGVSHFYVHVATGLKCWKVKHEIKCVRKSCSGDFPTSLWDEDIPGVVCILQHRPGPAGVWQTTETWWSSTVTVCCVIVSDRPPTTRSSPPVAHIYLRKAKSETASLHQMFLSSLCLLYFFTYTSSLYK